MDAQVSDNFHYVSQIIDKEWQGIQADVAIELQWDGFCEWEWGVWWLI